MRTRSSQTGFEAVIVVVMVAVIAVVGFAGYKIMNTSQPVASTEASAVAAPSRIKTKADLAQTGKSLDASAGQVDSNLNSAALNSDVSALL